MHLTKNINPLLDFSDLPRFAEIQAEQITPALDELLNAARQAVRFASAPDTPADWDNLITPLEQATERLSRAWSIVSHLHHVLDSPALRSAYNENLARITAFWTELGQNFALYAKYTELASSPAFESASATRRWIIQNALRDFRLSGAELSDSAKLRFAQIQEQLAALSQKFSENVLDATHDFVLWIDNPDELSGIPADEMAAMQAAAERDGQRGWKITLQMPVYLPVLQYAENRQLREKLYHAYVTRAAEFPNHNGQLWDNTALIQEILTLRQEQARLLGYANYAEVSLASKMASSPQQVLAFLEDLAQRARPAAERDIAELQEFAQTEFGLTHIEAWDLPYLSEKLRQQRYAFSENEVKQYFPEPQVLAGLFRVIQTLFGVTLKPDHFPTWHAHVRTFRIERAGELIGQFYLDPYARTGKRGGAWMDEVRGRKRDASEIQTPVAHLVCNFPEPVGNKPALLTHDDVITLFHECGHGLHHLLTQVDELAGSGIHGVEWDAVELPSQFMENFCWEWEVLQDMTAHITTGSALPRALYDKMLAAKNFQSGLQTLRQIEFALFDMRLHTDFAPQNNTPQALLQEIRNQIAVLLPPAYNRFQNSFSHIFAGGYAAGYYSYKWAEVLSADVYAQFEENGILNPQTGQHYWREILGVGGSRPALESFRAFRGRDPSIDALLRHSGMTPQASTNTP